MNLPKLRQRVCAWFVKTFADKRWAKKVSDALTIQDLWHLASKRVPPIVFEYFRGGADNEITLRANSIAW